jgi:putative membrane protein
MSIRHYTPRRRHRQGISDRKRNLLIIFLSLAIIAQLTTIFTAGNSRVLATWFSASSMALFSLFHATFAYGSKYTAIYILITASFGLFVEALDVATGWPFGGIKFSNLLEPKIFGVPIFIIIGWLMMAHPILVLARQISKHWIFFFGGVGLASWDLFLDPVMVKFGFWEWSPFTKSVPLEPSIPLSNTLGWLLSGMALMALLHQVLPKERRKGGIDFKLIVILLSLVWLTRMFSNIFIFHNYGVAIMGGVGLGLLLIPLIYKSLLGDV